MYHERGLVMNDPYNYAGALAASDTRMAAHRAIQPIKGELQLAILCVFKRQGACTAEYVERVTGMRQSTVSARINELRNAGYLEDSGERGRTASGRQAIKWRIKPQT